MNWKSLLIPNLSHMFIQRLHTNHQKYWLGRHPALGRRCYAELHKNLNSNKSNTNLVCNFSFLKHIVLRVLRQFLTRQYLIWHNLTQQHNNKTITRQDHTTTLPQKDTTSQKGKPTQHHLSSKPHNNTTTTFGPA